MKKLDTQTIRQSYQDVRFKGYKRKGVNFYIVQYFYLPLASRVIKLLLPTKITANQVTIFWVFLGFLSCLLLILGNYWISLLALLLIQVHIVLDAVDGSIARAKDQKSVRGVYIERVGADMIYTSYFFCIALGALKSFSPSFILVMGFCASFGYFFYKYTRRAKIYCSLVYNSSIIFDNSQIITNANSSSKVSFLRNLYRKTQFIWDPTFFAIISWPLAILDILYMIPIFYGLTYPAHFFISYIYQAKISDEWVSEWFHALKSH